MPLRTDCQRRTWYDGMTGEKLGPCGHDLTSHHEGRACLVAYCTCPGYCGEEPDPPTQPRPRRAKTLDEGWD